MIPWHLYIVRQYIYCSLAQYCLFPVSLSVCLSITLFVSFFLQAPDINTVKLWGHVITQRTTWAFIWYNASEWLASRVNLCETHPRVWLCRSSWLWRPRDHTEWDHDRVTDLFWFVSVARPQLHLVQIFHIAAVRTSSYHQHQLIKSKPSHTVVQCSYVLCTHTQCTLMPSSSIYVALHSLSRKQHIIYVWVTWEPRTSHSANILHRQIDSV